MDTLRSDLKVPVDAEEPVVLVPLHPEAERIESMCFRFDHGHGIERFGEDNEGFLKRQESNRVLMRQLYEEAMGQGFYPANKWFIQEKLYGAVNVTQKN